MRNKPVNRVTFAILLLKGARRRKRNRPSQTAPWTKTSYSKRSAADPQPKSRRKKQLTAEFFRKHKHAEKASTAELNSKNNNYNIYYQFLGVCLKLFLFSSVTLLKAAAIERIAADHAKIVYLDGDVLACREIDFAAAFAFTTSMAGVRSTPTTWWPSSAR